MADYKTDKEYWEHFWSKVNLPCRVNLNFSNDRVIARTLKKWLPDGDGKKSALEIGCAPGKWLIYLSEEFRYIPEGCEYLESAARTTQKNLELCNIYPNEIITGDFLNANFTGKKYDLIISLGFVEHFADPNVPIQKMVSLLNNGGYLVIGIPKFSGLNYYLAWYIDQTLDQKIISSHNIDIMNLHFFNKIADKYALKKKFINCVGGFEPALFDISKTPWWFQKIFGMINVTLNIPTVRALDLSFFSGYIMAVYSKGGDVNEFHPR